MKAPLVYAKNWEKCCILACSLFLRCSQMYSLWDDSVESSHDSYILELDLHAPEKFLSREQNEDNHGLVDQRYHWSRLHGFLGKLSIVNSDNWILGTWAKSGLADFTFYQYIYQCIKIALCVVYRDYFPGEFAWGRRTLGLCFFLPGRLNDVIN